MRSWVRASDGEWSQADVKVIGEGTIQLQSRSVNAKGEPVTMLSTIKQLDPNRNAERWTEIKVNGVSLPNLYQMLLPPEQRDKVFYVGNREFDPKYVGFVNSSPKDAFKFDTRLPGNRNTGHEYGTTLRDPEKWELIEYMKTL